MLELVGRKRAEYVEMMAAAFSKATDLPPEDCVLVQQIDGHTIKMWFERKGEVQRQVAALPPED